MVAGQLSCGAGCGKVYGRSPLTVLRVTATGLTVGSTIFHTVRNVAGWLRTKVVAFTSICEFTAVGLPRWCTGTIESASDPSSFMSRKISWKGKEVAATLNTSDFSNTRIFAYWNALTELNMWPAR